MVEITKRNFKADHSITLTKLSIYSKDLFKMGHGPNFQCIGTSCRHHRGI